jgi:DNA-binding protein H-NS
MSKLVTEFKSLTLSQQHEAYPAITAVYNAAKEARRVELEAEIRQLGFKPGEAKKPAAAGVKYRSKQDLTKGWGGRGAVATWLKEEMAATGLPLEAFKVP